MSDAHDGLNWFAFASVEKFSIDQAAYANAWIANHANHRMRRDMRRDGTQYHGLLADTMRKFTGQPEDGFREHAGNLLTTVGLNTITRLVGGVTPANKLYPFGNLSGTVNTGAACGVADHNGNSTQDAAVGDQQLNVTSGETGLTHTYYQQLDTGFPTCVNGLMTAQSTYATGNANFAWNEWCWVSGTGAITGGYQIAAIYATGASFSMLNHKVPASSLGTKASGASWVFTTTITLS
jgi:hypothetical protein